MAEKACIGLYIHVLCKLAFSKHLKNKVLYIGNFHYIALCLHNGTDLLQSQPPFQLDSHPYVYDRIDIMKKVWVYNRKSVNGWWVG